jgi:hypothetical protein
MNITALNNDYITSTEKRHIKAILSIPQFKSMLVDFGECTAKANSKQYTIKKFGDNYTAKIVEVNKGYSSGFYCHTVSFSIASKHIESC